MEMEMEMAEVKIKIGGIFVIRFNQRTGYELVWERAVGGEGEGEGLQLADAVEYKALPSGLHNVREDLITFTHGKYVGISAFRSEEAGVEDRGVRFVSVGVLVRRDEGVRIGRVWEHAEGVEELARKALADPENYDEMEKYWEKYHIENNPSNGSSNISLQNDIPQLDGIPSEAHDHIITSSTDPKTSKRSTSVAGLPSDDLPLSPSHPILSLTNSLDLLGPLIFPIFRATLLRKRVLLLAKPPLGPICDLVYILSLLATIPPDIIPRTSPNAINPLFTVGVRDIPDLQSSGSTTPSSSPDLPSPIRTGWIACTSDAVLGTKESLSDIRVSLPTSAPVANQVASQCPSVSATMSKSGSGGREGRSRSGTSGARSSNSVGVSATQRDLRRYKALRLNLVSIMRQHDGSRAPYRDWEGDADNNDDAADDHGPTSETDTAPLLSRPSSAKTVDEQDFTTFNVHFQDLVTEPRPWAASLYGSFKWLASAGQQGSGASDDEMEMDRTLWADAVRGGVGGGVSWNASMSGNGLDSGGLEMAVIRYFHGMTRKMFSTLAGLVDVHEAEDKFKIKITSEEVTEMGLDVWSAADREFVKQLCRVYFGKTAEVPASMNKPFRPPLRTNSAGNVQSPVQYVHTQPPAKKRRISDENNDVENVKKSEPIPASQPLTQHIKIKSLSTSTSLIQSATQIVRKPLVTVAKPPASPSIQQSGNDVPEGYYNVLYRKFTTKKHKTWEGDGILSVKGGIANLQDESGKELGRIPWNKPLLPGSSMSIGGKEVEIDSMISKQDFMAGKPFLNGVKPTVRDLDEKLRMNVKFTSPYVSGTKSTPVPHSKKSKPKAEEDDEVDVVPKPMARMSQASTAGFKNPLLANTVLPQGKGDIPVPRHDPNAPGALVMKRPTPRPGKQIVDVVVDPIVSSRLRQHQREGVQFMYECIMGMRPDSGGRGAVLADEMGLGKTLQIITLLWTLLKQSPYHGEKPVISKALIVCPVGLVDNWKKEFRKWLGNERVGVFVLRDDHSRITDFTLGRSYNVMIIGYEKLRNVQEEFQKGTGVDIVIADEGHRLKTKKNKSAEAIKNLGTDRCIVLSGTPLQNDLSEFYIMANLVNPGMLGSMNVFKKEFETPILQGRQPGASADAREKGEARSQELARLTGSFMLRRTADILAQWLPPKTEYVLFCKPTAAQVSVYRKVLASPVFDSVIGSRNGQSVLVLTTTLKKVCNSPSLLQAKDETDEVAKTTASSLLSNVPASLLKSPGASGKLQVLDSLLHRLRTTTEEKVVIVAHWTSTLDVIGNFLTSLSYTWLRLDGQTPNNKRQGLVDKFNRTDASKHFAFLLSAKSGGVGLNLIGASRLILFDIDWNPSTELQAMARIHRDGQKRPCYIYRMLMQGGLDEKIYQRQLSKLSLADSVVDNKASMPKFTPEELRDIFTLDESRICQTHTLLSCSCQGRGGTYSPPPLSTARSIEGHSSDDEDVPRLLSGMVKGVTQADIDAAEAYMQKKAEKAEETDKTDMAILKDYRHLDPALLATSNSMTMGDDGDALSEDDVAVVVEDNILLDVLKDKENRVSFVFAKTST